MSQSVINLKCENCGGELTVDEQGKYLTCPFCGSKEFIIDSDAVAVEKIRQQTAFRQWEREDNTQKEQERSAYRNSKAGTVSLIFAVICGIGCIVGFSSARNFYKVLFAADDDWIFAVYPNVTGINIINKFLKRRVDYENQINYIRAACRFTCGSINAIFYRLRRNPI